MRPTSRIAKLGMFVAAALVLYAVEAALPSLFPFLRLGLANIVTVVVLLTMGFADAIIVTVLRVTIASLIVGTFAGPGYALAMSGGLSAAVAMGLGSRLSPPLGVVGLSVIGAAAHNLAQLGVVAGLYTGARGALVLVPMALIVSGAAGLATGLVAFFVLEKLPLPRQNRGSGARSRDGGAAGRAGPGTGAVAGGEAT
jgi:heptaprenyl diphosphate synthase